MKNIIFENRHFKLTVGSDCKVKSFIHKPNGEEWAVADEEISLFSTTQHRPFNNEIKLAYMNKKTTYQANRLERDGDLLTVGFELAPYDAKIKVRERDDYISFELLGFEVHKGGYNSYLTMDTPPVSGFRLIQLPLAHGDSFGEWLNIIHKDGQSAAVVATSPYEVIDSEKRARCRILTADADADLKLIGAKAAIVAGEKESFLDKMNALEVDHDLPRGAVSRKNELINASAYWANHASPENIDEHIALAKRGGFRLMLFYYTSFFKEEYGYSLDGNYDLLDCYPRGEEDIKAVLSKVKEAGLHAGIHFLHTHIGMKSRYVTPVPDHRIGLMKHFTLARPLGEGEDTVYVEESPLGCQMYDGRRVLRFGQELISYESYTTERPYRFEGCVRGYNGTSPSAHPVGEIGGLLDISEYGASSLYLDQNSDLQDEIAEKLGKLYDLGFEFAYFDGSEGTNAPFAFHIANAQYRVYKKFSTPPMYCEGAAKTHFSWHILSGGNAFDVFGTDEFKDCITRFPFDEAKMMRDNFTRVNFGWWAWREDTRPDIYEFGTSRAAAWDSPITIQMNHLDAINSHPRRDDLLEVIRRWEDVRAMGLLSAEDKENLKNTDQEHIMLINEKGEYELCEYEEIKLQTKEFSAFYFNRGGESYVVCWCNTGSGELELPILSSEAVYTDELGSEPYGDIVKDGKLILHLDGRRYLRANVTKEEMTDAFRSATYFSFEKEK